MTTDPDAAIRRGLDALARAAWVEARLAFTDAGERADALEGLGMAAWWLDDAAAVFDARARAYRLFRAAGDRLAAGRVAMTIGCDHFYFRGEVAVARGWLGRARRLLDGLAPTPAHGWLRLWEGDLGHMAGADPAEVRDHAIAAAAIGRALGDVDLEMTALALEGLARVGEGTVAAGMPLLDEATAAAMSGEMSDPVAIGLACCYLMSACERIRDFDRAGQWCARVKEQATKVGFTALIGVCRAQYASVLLWTGAWAEAESELTGAIEQLAGSRPGMQAEGVLRLAELRRLQGRFDEAGALLAGLDAHPNAAVARAALALDRGDPASAAHQAARFLRGGSDRTERSRALELLQRAQLRLDRRDEAAASLVELRALAGAIGTAPMRAACLVAEGLDRAAAGEHDRARGAFEDAIDLYATASAPHLQACARIELAASLRALGHVAAADAELARADAALAALGARPREVAPAPRPSKLTAREIEVLRLVAEGLSNRRIAKKLAVSELTIKRHVANMLLKLDLPSRAAAAAYAAKSGLL